MNDAPEQRTVPPNGQPDEAQPDWRRAFPIDVAQDNDVARRDFTNLMVLTSLACVVGQGWIGLQNYLRSRQASPGSKQIARVDEVPVGSARHFHYPGEEDTCILVRPDAETFLAYDQKCTHLSCAVLPHLEQSRLECPCHHGAFDLRTGRPLAGPPRRPLTQIKLEIRANIVYAVGVELRTV